MLNNHTRNFFLLKTEEKKTTIKCITLLSFPCRLSLITHYRLAIESEQVRLVLSISSGFNFSPLGAGWPGRGLRNTGPNCPPLVSAMPTRQTRCITRSIERKWKSGCSGEQRRPLAMEQIVSACKQIGTRIVTAAFCPLRSADLIHALSPMLGHARIPFASNGKNITAPRSPPSPLPIFFFFFLLSKIVENS